MASPDNLDLSDNRLSGDIENVVRLRSLRVLRLCSNKFSGKVRYEIVKQFLHEDCFDRFNLVSDNGTKGQSNRHFVIMIVMLVGCGVVGFAITYYLVGKCWLKKQTIDSRRKHSGPSVSEEDEWKMITFERLEFNETEILSSLTDENLIGYGGAGKVYRVYMNEGSNAVAVKIIVNPRKSDCGLEKEFLAEIKTLGTIWHNNIVKLLCYLSSKELKLLVYQYVENKSLHQWLKVASVDDTLPPIPS